MATPSPEPELARVPSHIAIIMDGNGRWAKARGLPRAAGHKRGADAVRRVVEGCHELGVSYLTLFAFSSENWKRPEEEVNDLMGLFRLYFRVELKKLHERNVRVRFIGQRDDLAEDIVGMIADAETKTANNSGLNLVIALNYGGRAEIIRAARLLAQDLAAGEVLDDKTSEDRFTGYLQTDDIPDPDMIIRTSGEQRLSNFLLWQAAYSEILFMNQLWPDFDKSCLEEAIEEFNRRERRYGAVS